MHLIADQLYHIYNQGNNREAIFREREDYLHFLHKFRAMVFPNGNLLSYCLMPNHFHFLFETTPRSIEKIRIGSLEVARLSNAFRLLLSEYAQEFNQKYKRSGSLFRQRTKGKYIKERNHALLCFHYIHQNPVKAHLVPKLEDWEFSSFQDYLGERRGTLCQKELAYRSLDLCPKTFYNDSYEIISEHIFNDLCLEKRTKIDLRW